jgi:hypothetical protein
MIEQEPVTNDHSQINQTETELLTIMFAISA